MREAPLGDALRSGGGGTGMLLVRLYHTEGGAGSNTAVSSVGLVSAGSATASFLAVPDGSSLVRLLDSSSNTPIPNTEVFIYAIDCRHSRPNCAPSDISPLQRATTGPDGLASFPPEEESSRNHRRALIAVTPSGETLLLPDLPYQRAPALPPPRGILISDRSVYKPGEEVFLKGYLREVAKGSLSFPDHGVQAEVVVRWEAEAATTTGDEFSSSLSAPPKRSRQVKHLMANTHTPTHYTPTHRHPPTHYTTHKHRHRHTTHKHILLFALCAAQTAPPGETPNGQHTHTH